MQIYLDTANLREIREAASWGILSGVTTNPSLVAKEQGIDHKTLITEITKLVDGPISAEAISLDAEGMIREVDGDVTPGQTYQYRLRVTQNGAERFSGITSITVPARITFALEGARPNPAVGAPSIAFSLADDAPATLSLLDVTGRLIVSRAVGTLGGGAHVLSLDPGRTLRPGVYLVRLTQRGQSLTSRVSLVR